MTTLPDLSTHKLEELDRDELISTIRTLLVQANALSSRISSLNEIGIAINRTLNVEEILQVVSRQAKWLLDFEHCSACLKEGDEWKLFHLFGKTCSFEPSQLEKSNIGKVINSQQSWLVAKSVDDPIFGDFQSQLIIPLNGEDGKAFGTLNFASSQANLYTREDLRIGYMLTLHLSAALLNARHMQELREAREEISRNVAELEETNAELDAFARTLAHDLQNPLASIVGYAELMRRYVTDLPAKGSEILEEIIVSSYAMSDMVKQLLQLARLRNAHEQVVPVDVQTTAFNIKTRLGKQLADRGVALSIVEPLPSALGHDAWVQEIFANLVSNAIKYIGENNANPTITIQAKELETSIRYEVVDNGIGISEEHQKTLFEMFTRFHLTEAEGYGLGLSLVARMAHKMNGTFGVDSEVGKGSTFWFTLDKSDILEI